DASPSMATPIPGAQMAPDFSLPDLDGQTWTLSQFRGQPVMLFMWATW
ncbi:MAG: redoxin domain-containing protein, partial [Anaerolineae bacterium]|nr:redoxin domain-containing protein [Anaerolineae bacterium]